MLEKRNPTKRLGEIHEFGFACAWMCSAHSGYLTGQNILIDGGRQQTSSGNYTQVQGWMPLCTAYFLPGHPGGITQTGAFDAFRVVSLTPDRNNHRGYPPFGSLSIDTDAVMIPPGIASDYVFSNF